jgi:hypothetical protein
MEEDDARGFTSGNASLICAKHFDDYALKAHIGLTGEKGICDYCDPDDAEENDVITFDDLVDIIAQGISNHYGNPDDEGVGFDSSEGAICWTKFMTPTICFGMK